VRVEEKKLLHGFYNIWDQRVKEFIQLLAKDKKEEDSPKEEL
jgi:hypothetical protein